MTKKQRREPSNEQWWRANEGRFCGVADAFTWKMDRWLDAILRAVGPRDPEEYERIREAKLDLLYAVQEGLGEAEYGGRRATWRRRTAAERRAISWPWGDDEADHLGVLREIAGLVERGIDAGASAGPADAPGTENKRSRRTARKASAPLARARAGSRARKARPRSAAGRL